MARRYHLIHAFVTMMRGVLPGPHYRVPLCVAVVVALASTAACQDDDRRGSWSMPGPSSGWTPHKVITLAKLDDVGAGRMPGLTLEAELILDGRPAKQAVLLSRWAEGERSFELGIDAWQRPYVWIAEDNDAPPIALVAQRQIRLGHPVRVTAVFEAGKRLELYIGDERVASAPKVPLRVAASDAPTVVAGRSGCGAACTPSARWGSYAWRNRAFAPDLAKTGRAHPPQPLGFAPVRRLTRGPRHHWFGYYDKHQVDRDGRYLLALAVDFEGRSPTADDVVDVGVVDLQRDDAWIPLARTRAWNWQQGAMLQWRPRRGPEAPGPRELLFNDRQGQRFVTRVMDFDTRALRTLHRPVYHLAPNGRRAVGLDFARIEKLRRGYGYAGLPDPSEHEPMPAGSTIYLLDLDSDESRDLVTVAQVAKIASRGYSPPADAFHYFNHLQLNADGSRLLFFHRYKRKGETKFGTRVFTLGLDDGEVRLLTEDAGLSHYAWRDEQHVVIWSRPRGGYAEYADRAGEGYERTLLAAVDGHHSFVPTTQGRWMVSDTYPDAAGMQMPFLYDRARDEIFILGRFAAPKAYRGEFRVDNHPRVDRDGRYIFIDSAHDDGRQIYALDISAYLTSGAP
jgi:hypothetical protein